jgi:peptidoglycan biosynthesis protein MviN/MurJ (putative lipid II flippase)
MSLNVIESERNEGKALSLHGSISAWLCCYFLWRVYTRHTMFLRADMYTYGRAFRLYAICARMKPGILAMLTTFVVSVLYCW